MAFCMPFGQIEFGELTSSSKYPRCIMWHFRDKEAEIQRHQVSHARSRTCWKSCSNPSPRNPNPEFLPVHVSPWTSPPWPQRPPALEAGWTSLPCLRALHLLPTPPERALPLCTSPAAQPVTLVSHPTSLRSVNPQPWCDESVTYKDWYLYPALLLSALFRLDYFIWPSPLCEAKGAGIINPV